MGIENLYNFNGRICINLAGNRIAHYLAAACIQDYRHIDETGLDANERSISGPGLIGQPGDHIAIEVGEESRVAFVAILLGRKTLMCLDAQPMLSHDPISTFTVNACPRARNSSVTPR